jgi:hypothetical protein
MEKLFSRLTTAHRFFDLLAKNLPTSGVAFGNKAYIVYGHALNAYLHRIPLRHD